MVAKYWAVTLVGLIIAGCTGGRSGSRSGADGSAAARELAWGLQFLVPVMPQTGDLPSGTSSGPVALSPTGLSPVLTPGGAVTFAAAWEDGPVAQVRLGLGDRHFAFQVPSGTAIAGGYDIPAQLAPAVCKELDAGCYTVQYGIQFVSPEELAGPVATASVILDCSEGIGCGGFGGGGGSDSDVISRGPGSDVWSSDVNASSSDVTSNTGGDAGGEGSWDTWPPPQTAGYTILELEDASDMCDQAPIKSPGADIDAVKVQDGQGNVVGTLTDCVLIAGLCDNDRSDPSEAEGLPDFPTSAEDGGYASLNLGVLRCGFGGVVVDASHTLVIYEVGTSYEPFQLRLCETIGGSCTDFQSGGSGEIWMPVANFF